MFFELLQRTLHLNFIKKPWGPFGLPAHGKIADQSVHAHPACNEWLRQEAKDYDNTNWLSPLSLTLQASENMTEGSLEVKLPTIWMDEKQRWEESERREE